MRFVLAANDEVVREVIELASRPENVIDFETGPPAARDSRRVLIFDGTPSPVRCVFSVTRLDGILYRELSAGFLTLVGFPGPDLVRALGKLWGFTGELGSDWIAKPHECDGCDCPPNVLFVQAMAEQPS